MKPLAPVTNIPSSCWAIHDGSRRSPLSPSGVPAALLRETAIDSSQWNGDQESVRRLSARPIRAELAPGGYRTATAGESARADAAAAPVYESASVQATAGAPCE